MSRQTRTRLLTAGVLMTVFGAGVLLGFAADMTVKPSPASAALLQPDGTSETVEEGEEAPSRLPMYEQVGPDSAQSVKIAALVEEHRARMDSLHREFQEIYDPRYRTIVEDTREAIKEVFTDEQAAQYQQLVDERDRARARAQAGGSDA